VHDGPVPGVRGVPGGG